LTFANDTIMEVRAKPRIQFTYRTLLIFSSWLFCNVALSFTNKFLFKYQGFKFPFFIIFLGTFSTMIGTGIIAWRTVDRLQYRLALANWRTLTALGLIHALDVGLENLSLVYINITMNQVIKSTMPAFTILLSWWFEGKTYGLRLILATAMTVVGAVMLVYNNPQVADDGIVGVIAASVSTICASIATILIGLLLQREKMNASLIAASSSLPGVLLLLVVVGTFEFPALTAMKHVKWNETYVTLCVIFITVMALLYNLSRYYLVKFTEAHYSVIAGSVKVAVIVFLSMLVFGDHYDFTARNYVGAILALVGFVAYSLEQCRVMRHQRLVTVVRATAGAGGGDADNDDDNDVEK